jgi:hypothetical protein
MLAPMKASGSGARFASIPGMKFAIRNTSNARMAASNVTYDSLEAARAALREALGWPEVALGPGYTTASGTGQVWCAYRTQVEAAADPDGLNTPRIVRLAAPEADHSAQA